MITTAMAHMALVLVERDRLFLGQGSRAIDQPLQFCHRPGLGQQAYDDHDRGREDKCPQRAEHIFSHRLGSHRKAPCSADLAGLNLTQTNRLAEKMMPKNRPRNPASAVARFQNMPKESCPAAARQKC